MAQSSSESVVLDSPAPQVPSSTPAQQIETQKPKRRERLLRHLSSSPSLAKASRSRPTFRYGPASVSCISLSSASSPYASCSSSLPAEWSAGYSTVPTSAVTTPGIRAFTSDGRASAPHFFDLKSTSRLVATPGIAEEEDYFSIPVKKPRRHRRPNFNFWQDLPSELRIHILSYLQPREVVRCSAVSKQWHKMCLDGQLWQDMDTSDFYRDIPADALVNIITAAGPFVRDLNLRGCIQLREKWYSKGLAEACRNLQNFSLEGCRIDRTSIHCFLLQNTRLVHINLSGLANATNSTMKIISQACPRVEYLNISWCNNIDTRGLRRVVEACPNLKDIRAGEVRGWDDVDLMQLLFEKNSLERLILMNCDSLNDASLSVLIEGQDSEMDYLTGRPIVSPRKLKHLDLTRCRGITDKSVATLINNVPEMEGLQLSKVPGITDQTMISMISSMPKLTHLDLEELDSLSNTVLTALSNAACSKTIRHLGISYCEELGDVGMLPVLKSCTNLRSLDMDNTRISDLTLAEAASLVRTRSSRTSSVHDRPKIGLRLVAYDCQNVTWTGIREILSRNAEVITSRRPAPVATTTEDGADAPACTHPSATRTYPSEIIQLKCFYNYQPTVEEHTKRVLRADFAAANRLERKWAGFMIAQEEAGASGAGARRRRRRAREAQMMHVDEEGEGGNGGGAVGGGRRRRARSGGCVVM